MDIKAHLFILLLRLGIGTMKASDNECEALLSLSIKQWKELMAMSKNQGVTAIAMDGLQELYNSKHDDIEAAKISKQGWMMLILEYASLMNQYEQRNAKQTDVIADISETLHKEGVRMMVFKGQANATFYPKPLHRAPGDIDCYLFGEADKGDRLLVKDGATVDNNWYRHSKILYKSETIENHRVMGYTRGSRKKKEMEKEFQSMINREGLTIIDGCGVALMPTAQFNACFLTYHGLHHFLSEGLRMKQVLDWALFLKSYQKDIDWDAYNDFCMRYKLDKFAATMTYIAFEFLSVDVEDTYMDGTYAERLLQNTLFDNDYLFNSGKSDWIVRWQLIKNMLTRDRWKYEDIAQENVWKHLFENVKGFLLKEEE